MNGRVTLIGAGPGDPDLLTLRAVRRLADADLVLYDALSSPELRALAPEARWFFVGKRARRESISQEAISRILVREARRGHHVVRLKCGDPFVLGRGGEEAIALAEAGVPCEVVPGVSSALAAPALAGIPVTHRGLASGVLVFSGHAEASFAPIVDGLSPGPVTLVVLMGLGTRARLAARLLARGFAPETPAAIVLGAATPDAWRWVGPLAAIADAALPTTAAGASREAPGLLVIGEVAALGPRLVTTFGAAASAIVDPRTAAS